MNCPKCNFDNPSQAKFCNQCATPLTQSEPIQVKLQESLKIVPKNDWAYRAGRTWAKMNADSRFSVALGGFVILAIVVLFIGWGIREFGQSSSNRASSEYYESRSSPSVPSSSNILRPAEPAKPPGMTAADHLETAKVILDGTITADDIQNAKDHLILIPQSAAEYKEARGLLDKIRAGKIRPLTEFEIEHQEAITALRTVDNTLTMAKIKKNPDRYYGESWAFTGKILEITERGNLTVARVGVGAYGLEAIWVEAPFTTEFVDNNNVFVIGTIKGTKSYTSQAGWEITIPHVQAVAIVKPSEGSKLKGAASQSGN
jgi:hypothetical protein